MLAKCYVGASFARELGENTEKNLQLNDPDKKEVCMEIENDAQLIQRILSGDDSAFNTLVQKYQKGVHALAWRKIGDFHYAEEITQDTFLQAYKNLSTLSNPDQFAGWLYVIATRLCIDWQRKQKFVPQSLQEVSVKEIEESTYARYISEKQETESRERRYEIVEKILKRLPESERTVVTLHYLGEMTAKEIGKFLGVSVGTIDSRLHRARKRLKNSEERLVQEVLEGVHLSAHISQNIMREVADLKPTPEPTQSPLLPWAAVGAAAVFIAVLLGGSNQYLTRFQPPYSFDAEVEPTIIIIDAPEVLALDTKPAVRNQAGHVGATDTTHKKNSVGSQESEQVSTSNAPGLSIQARVQNRSFPSTFKGWGGMLNQPTLSHEAQLAHHDLSWTPRFGLRFQRTAHGLQLSGSLMETERDVLMEMNPNKMSLFEIWMRRADPDSPLYKAIYDADFPWIRDAAGNRVPGIREEGGSFLIDFTHPDVQDIIVQQALAVKKCGLYDGIFIGSWNEDGPDLNGHRTLEAEQQARSVIMRRIRAEVGDDFLIIVNAGHSKPMRAAPYINGLFIRAGFFIRKGDEHVGDYSYERLMDIESTLSWAEESLRSPQVNCLEGWGVETEAPDSATNLRWMRAFTTLGLTHSDGYVLHITKHNGIYWYEFWDAPLGKPVGKKAQLYKNRKGLFIREFTNGWAVYNRSRQAQEIALPEVTKRVGSGVTARLHTVPDLDGEIFLKKGDRHLTKEIKRNATR